MSRWRPDPWYLVVDEASCVLARRGTGSRPVCLMKADGPWRQTMEPLMAQASTAGHELGRLEVIVVGRLAQHWSCQAPRGAASLRDLRTYASARRQQQFGDASADEWWVEADWRATAGFICMAVPQALVDFISAMARSLKLRWALCTDMGLFMATNPRLWPSREAQWAAIETPQGGLLWHIDPLQGTRFMRAWRHGVQLETPSRPSDDAQAEWRRAQLRAGESASGPLTWVRADELSMTITSLSEEGDLSAQPTVHAWPSAPSQGTASWLDVLARHGGRL